MNQIAGQSILITGAAHGIGAETARRLAERGARIALVGLAPDELERVAAQCPGSIAIEADVTDRGAVERAVAQAAEALGGIDTVIANAGIAAPAFVRTGDPDDFERTIDVNLLGVFRTVRACLPHVIERKGYVLPVASFAALGHAPAMSAYSAAKAGVEAFGNALRIELRPFGVGVGVAYFSWIDTEMVRGADAGELGGALRGLLKGPMARTYPVGEAAEALISGIEKRRRIVVWPRWLLGAYAGRALLPFLTEAMMARNVADLDKVAEREAARGDSGAVGEGGAADRGARASKAAG